MIQFSDLNQRWTNALSRTLLYKSDLATEMESICSAHSQLKTVMSFIVCNNHKKAKLYGALKKCIEIPYNTPTKKFTSHIYVCKSHIIRYAKV